MLAWYRRSMKMSPQCRLGGLSPNWRVTLALPTHPQVSACDHVGGVSSSLPISRSSSRMSEPRWQQLRRPHQGSTRHPLPRHSRPCRGRAHLCGRHLPGRTALRAPAPYADRLTWSIRPTASTGPSRATRVTSGHCGPRQFPRPLRGRPSRLTSVVVLPARRPKSPTGILTIGPRGDSTRSPNSSRYVTFATSSRPLLARGRDCASQAGEV